MTYKGLFDAVRAERACDPSVLSALRDALLPKFISGALRLKHVELFDEVAA
jgi:hypothetical protein